MLARTLSSLIILLMVLSPVSAAVVDWTGFAGASGFPPDQVASNPGNWFPTVPVAGDDVNIQFCQGWELLGQAGLEWDLNISLASLKVKVGLCDGIIIMSNSGNWLKATNHINIHTPTYLSFENVETPNLYFDPLLVHQPFMNYPLQFSTLELKGDQHIAAADVWYVIDINMQQLPSQKFLDNDGSLELCNIYTPTSYNTAASSGVVVMIQQDRCISAPPVCGLAGEITATGFKTASGITNNYLTFSTNLKLGVNSRGTINGSCDITGHNNYNNNLSLVFYENSSLGSVFSTPNFDVDYDGNYSAYCSGQISIDPTVSCNDTYAFTIDRAEHAEQKSWTTAAVLLFTILFAALFTGIGLMINSTPMKILMYMFGISAGIMGINYSHLALREWVKVPALIGVVETFAYLANWTYYFIIAILLVMIIVWALNSLNNDPEDDVEFMN